MVETHRQHIRKERVESDHPTKQRPLNHQESLIMGFEEFNQEPFRWGKQKTNPHRCRKPRDEISNSSSPESESGPSRTVPVDAAQNMLMGLNKDQPLCRDKSPVDELPPAVTKPWNLRSRKAAAAAVDGNAVDGNQMKEKGVVEERRESSRRQTLRRANEALDAQKKKFSIALSRDEIEQDFLRMGITLPKRPNKRPRKVQMELDNVFPGLELAEITAKKYDVPPDEEVDDYEWLF